MFIHSYWVPLHISDYILLFTQHPVYSSKHNIIFLFLLMLPSLIDHLFLSLLFSIYVYLSLSQIFLLGQFQPLNLEVQQFLLWFIFLAYYFSFWSAINSPTEILLVPKSRRNCSSIHYDKQKMFTKTTLIYFLN